MSAHIRYAYLKGHTWLYRCNYPVDVALALGAQALKQSLKTRDRNTARVRAAEVSTRFVTLVEQVRSQAEETLSAPENTADVPDWLNQPESTLVRLRSTLGAIWSGHRRAARADRYRGGSAGLPETGVRIRLTTLGSLRWTT